MNHRYLKIAGRATVYLFAGIGLFLTAGFFAVKFHLTDSLGAIDLNDRYFARTASAIRQAAQLSDRSGFLAENLCRAQAIKKAYPENGAKILSAYDRSRSDTVLAKMVAAAEINLLNDAGYQAEAQKCRAADMADVASVSLGGSNLYGWINTPEWQTLKAGLAKDQEVINQVGAQTHVPPRLIVAQIVGEQLRLFHTEREAFKQFFQPLKILGNEVQFSLGVAGIKEETAIKIENGLADRSSEYYPGPDYERMIEWKTADHSQERFERLTDPKNRYYSYLYTALFLKEIEAQWQKAGFDISDRPEVLATIFNLGFAKSKPKADPQVGGSEIEISGRKYTFGALAYEFYYSGELGEEFPVE